MWIFLLAAGVAACTKVKVQHEEPLVEKRPVIQTEPVTTVSTNLPTYGYVPRTNKNIQLFVEQSYTDSLLDLLDPEWLKGYEGSYTMDELRNREDESSTFSLNTSWVMGNSNIPQVGVVVGRNPLTGTYELSGGEVFLPKSGVGVSYERDETRDETRTFLNWKRAF